WGDSHSKFSSCRVIRIPQFVCISTSHVVGSSVRPGRFAREYTNESRSRQSGQKVVQTPKRRGLIPIGHLHDRSQLHGSSSLFLRSGEMRTPRVNGIIERVEAFGSETLRRLLSPDLVISTVITPNEVGQHENGQACHGPPWLFSIGLPIQGGCHVFKMDPTNCQP
ncbi:hypothetical protein CORC01_13675, partial [Colletotrichum orchidophilum]